MSGRNWGKFLNDNIVFLTGIPLIIGIHWGWWRIQQNPDLVDFKEHREWPIYSAYKIVYRNLLGDSPNETAEHEEGIEK